MGLDRACRTDRPGEKSEAGGANGFRRDTGGRGNADHSRHHHGSHWRRPLGCGGASGSGRLASGELRMGRSCVGQTHLTANYARQ